MPLTITDFVEQVEGVTVEDISEKNRKRINDALADLTGGPGGGGEAGPVNEDAILVSKNLNGRAGFTSVQDAIDGNSPQNGASGASSGDTIFVESGTYDETITASVSDLTLRATNSGTPRIEGRIKATGDGVTVDGFTVSPPDPGDTQGADEAIRVSNSADGVTIVDNVVEDFARNTGDSFTGVDGINIFGGDSGETIDPVENTIVRNNTVRRLQNTGGSETEFPGGAAGISVQGAVRNPTVEGNTIENIGEEVTNFGFGIVVRGTGNNDETPTGVTIKDNTIDSVLSDPDSPTVGVGIGLEAGRAGDVTFTGNSISNTEFLLEDKTATVDLNSFASSNTLDRGALLENGDFGDATRNVIFDSIQFALNFATSGDTLDVVSGTYDEQVSIETSDITIFGAGQGETVIQPSQDLNYGDRANIVGANIVEITADDVTLENIEVDGDNPSLSPAINAPLGVYLNQAVGATVRNCTVRNTNAADSQVTIGVWAPPNSAVTVENSTFDNHQTGVFVRGQVNVRSSTFTNVSRGVNTNNINGSTTVDGIEYGEIVGNIIKANSLGIRLNNHYTNDNGSGGPSQSGTPTYSVRNNDVSGATEGINVLSISNAADVDLKNNDVSDCVRGYDLTNLTTSETIRIDGGSVTNCDTGLVAFSDNGAFDGAQYGGPVDNLSVGSDVTFQNNGVDIRAYGADATMTYDGTSAGITAENSATIN
jgi:hypothetical protein